LAVNNLLRQDKHCFWGEPQEAHVLKMTILFESGKTRILRHYHSNRPVLIQTDASDFAIPDIVLHQFEDGKIHPMGLVSGKLCTAERNYDVYHKEIWAVVIAFNQTRHFLHAAGYMTTDFSDCQNLMYCKTALLLN